MALNCATTTDALRSCGEMRPLRSGRYGTARDDFAISPLACSRVDFGLEAVVFQLTMLDAWLTMLSLPLDLIRLGEMPRSRRAFGGSNSAVRPPDMKPGW